MHALFARIRAAWWLFAGYIRAILHYRSALWKNLDIPGGLRLTTKERGRLKHYFYGVTFLETLMGNYRGRFLSRRERFLFDQLATLAFFFDDLSESFASVESKGILWENNPEAFGEQADESGLAIHLLHRIYKRLPAENLQAFRDYMHRVFNLEIQGRQKKTGPQEAYVSNEAIWDITAEKGGASVLLFRSVLDWPMAQPEAEAWFQFGALIQLCDDIFDLWHDRRDGIQTPATLLAQAGNIEGLQALFDAQRNRCHAAFRSTASGKIQIESCLHIVHYLASITRVCLKHYHRLKRENGVLPLDSRTKIVVDMEKFRNIWAAIRELLSPIR